MKTIPLAVACLLILPRLIAGEHPAASPNPTFGIQILQRDIDGKLLDPLPAVPRREPHRARPPMPVEALGRDRQKTEPEKPVREKPQPAVATLTALDMETGKLREIGSIPDYPIINSPEVSPDGEWIGVDGWKADQNLRDARIFLVNTRNGSAINLVKGCMPSWSADGKWIAFCKYPPERGVYIRSLEDQTEKLIDADGWGIQWAPDGLKAAYTRGGGFIIYDFIGDTKTEIKTKNPWPYVRIYWNSTWSSDSKQICFLGTRESGKMEVGILNLDGDQPTFRVRADGDEFHHDIAWNARGDMIAMPRGSTPGNPGQILVFDPNHHAPPRPLEHQPTNQVNGGMCWTPDGKTLIFLTRR